MSEKLFERYARSSDNVPVESEIRRLFREVEEYIHSVAAKRYDAKNTFRFNYGAMTDDELSAAWTFFTDEDIDVTENNAHSQWMISRGDVMRKLNLAGKKVNSTEQYLLHNYSTEEDGCFEDIAIFIGDLNRDADKEAFTFLFTALEMSENYVVDVNELIKNGYVIDQDRSMGFALKKLPTFNLSEELVK